MDLNLPDELVDDVFFPNDGLRYCLHRADKTCFYVFNNLHLPELASSELLAFHEVGMPELRLLAFPTFDGRIVVNNRVSLRFLLLTETIFLAVHLNHSTRAYLFCLFFLAIAAVIASDQLFGRCASYVDVLILA